MSDPVFAEKDPAVVLSEALAIYKEKTGVTLSPADPRRLHLQTVLLIVTQNRGRIDYAGKQNLLRFVSDDWIDILAELLEEQRLPSRPSTCLQRFFFPTGGTYHVPLGVRVTDDTNTWTVEEALTENASPHYIECKVVCTENGAGSNQVAPGQIDTCVDQSLVPGLVSTANSTETSDGRDTESLEAFRERLRDAPESSSTCGPRIAYEAMAVKVSETVADARALGPDDVYEMAGPPPEPGEVWVLIIEGQRDSENSVSEVVPDPSGGLISEVQAALSAEDVRPLTDFVTVKAPEFVDFDTDVTYYIAESRSDSADEIQAAVQEAYSAWLLWQQSAIGRDINPSKLIGDLMAAGAKRVDVVLPAFAALMRDQSARLYASHLVYGGVEDD